MAIYVPTPEEEAQIVAYARKMIGIPYELNTYGPNTYDCWGLVRDTQKELFGREYGTLDIADNSVATFIRAFVKEFHRCNLKVVPEPEHGCIVEMSHSIMPHHVGTYLNIGGGGILHCMMGAGVVFDNLLALKASGWRRFIYNVAD